MIKFTCVNSDKAETAKQQLSKLGLDVKVVNRTILAPGAYTDAVVKVMCDAMAYSESPNEWDMGKL